MTSFLNSGREATDTDGEGQARGTTAAARSDEVCG